MTENDVKICLGELKNKKCEGFDRIPVCMLLDAKVKILPHMANLFNAIYQTCKIRDQWKVAKIVPILVLETTKSPRWMRLTVPLEVFSITTTEPKRAGEMYQEPLKLVCAT